MPVVLIIIAVAAYTAFLLWDLCTNSKESFSVNNSRLSFSVTVKVPKANKEKARCAIDRRWSEFKAGKLNEITLHEMIEEDIERYNGHITRWNLELTP
jgi:predicted secreted Zn-dependent protease